MQQCRTTKSTGYGAALHCYILTSVPNVDIFTKASQYGNQMCVWVPHRKFDDEDCPTFKFHYAILYRHLALEVMILAASFRLGEMKMRCTPELVIV